MSSQNTVSTLRLGDYLQVIRRQWLVIAIGLVLGLGLALVYLQVAPREYRSTTAVLVTPVADTNSGSARSSSINLDTEAQLVTATDTVSAAAGRLGLDAGQARSLAPHVSVSVPANTDILDITYTDTTPAAAQRGSLAFAQAYLDQRKDSASTEISAETKALQDRITAISTQLQQLLQATAALPANSPERTRNEDQATSLNSQLNALGAQQNQLQASIVSPGRIVTQPGLPGSPSSPRTAVSLAAGIILGLIAGLGVAYLRNRADDQIRDPEDLFRRTGVPVAAVLSSRLHTDSVSILPPLSSDGRGYARLRNLVTTSLMSSNRPVLVVAGVRYGGGSVAANLAASLGRAGEDVYLVCADVFGSTAAGLLGDQSRPGLAEVLAGEVDLDSAMQAVPGIPTMRVLGPGRDPDQADALLQTRSPRKLIDRLVDSRSYVVVEAPATASSPDAQTLANVAELAVLVVEVDQTGAREVLDACAQFESMGTPVLGAVVARYGKDGDFHPADAAPAEDADEAPEPPDDGTDGSSPDGDAGTGTGTSPNRTQLIDRDAVPVPPGSPADEPRTVPANAGLTDGPRPGDTQIIQPVSRDTAGQ
jgi:uncharacterized protein involved in exopolysaccharide biosynthesis